MGEVRARVIITNAVDEALARRGQIDPSVIRRYEADALIDKGAVRSIIPSHVAQQLGVASRGQRVVQYADGRNDTVDVSEAVIIKILDRDTLEEALILGDEVLIGQTVLEKTDVMVDCTGQRVIPNPAHPDQPVTKVK